MNKLEISPAIDPSEKPRFLRRDVLTEQMNRPGIRMTPAEIVNNSLNREDVASILHIITVFRSEDFQGLINQGNITVAMVRPQADDSRLDGTDNTASRTIIEAIKQQQHIMLEFSCIFSRRMCGAFYSGRPKEIQQTMPGIRTPSITRWEEFVRQMTSGPSTVLILYSPDGDAIPRWRKQVGVVRNTESDPSSIRGKFGCTDNYNNLVHGSDSIKSVHREIQFFRNYLAGIVKHYDR